MAIPQAMTTTVRGAARAVKALLAAAITAGVLGGIPWGLLHYAGDPLPHSIPHLDAVKHALNSTMTPQVLLKCLSVVGWYLWLILAVSFAVELVAAARRVNAPHIPTLGPTQTLAAALITAIGITALLRTVPAQATENSITPTGARVAATAPSVAGTTSLYAAHAALGTTTTATTPRESVHTVKPGESLYSIAKEDLGDGNEWPQLYKLNEGVVQADGDKLTNPDLIRPDWTIRITPTAASSVAPTTGTPATTTHVPATPAPATPAPALSNHPATPPPTGPAAPDTARTTPSAPHAGTPATSHIDRADETKHERAARRHGGAAVGLPDGGAIGITLAIALGSAVVLARRWRTRLSDPRFPSPEPPLPGALLAARRANLALAAQASEPTPKPDEPPPVPEDLFDLALDDEDHELLLTPEADDDSHREPEAEDGEDAIDGYFDDEPYEDALDEDHDDEGSDYGLGTRYGVPLAPGSISAAERDGAEIPLAPTGPGLGLVGPGAAGAARAIAAAVLSAGAPDRTADLARLIIPAADLAALLGAEAAILPELTRGVPELTVTPDLAAAIGEAEVHALWRTRLLEEYEVPDLDALAADYPEEVDCPPLVLMASPTRADMRRIAALIDDASHLRITAVLLGAHPSSVTAFVETDGSASGPGLAQWTGTRLFDLSADSFTAVLRLLGAASGNQAHDPETPSPTPRTELTVVAYQAPQDEAEDAVGENTPHTGQQEIIAAGTTHAVLTDNDAADTREAPRLVLIADPAEQIATDMLQAWSKRPIRIRILGPLRIEASGAPVTKMRSQARTLAALLAWKGTAGISDAGIDAACMPDENDLERVARWRQDGLKSLRARLRESTGRRMTKFVELRDRRDYLLDPEHVAVDLWLFRALHAAAGAAREESDQLRWLQQAVEFCGAELLADQTGPDFAWADWPRVTLRSEQVAVLTRYADLSIRAEQSERALTALRRAATLSDDNEYIYVRIFELLAAMGRHAEIAAQMQILDASADAVGATVSTATREHAARLLRHGTTAGTASGNQGTSQPGR